MGSLFIKIVIYNFSFEQATAEQIRLAKIHTSDKQIDDPELQNKITQVFFYLFSTIGELVVLYFLVVKLTKLMN